jgi:hypothetical protein
LQPCVAEEAEGEVAIDSYPVGDLPGDEGQRPYQGVAPVGQLAGLKGSWSRDVTTPAAGRVTTAAGAATTAG